MNGPLLLISRPLFSLVGLFCSLVGLFCQIRRKSSSVLVFCWRRFVTVQRWLPYKGGYSTKVVAVQRWLQYKVGLPHPTLPHPTLLIKYTPSPLAPSFSLPPPLPPPSSSHLSSLCPALSLPPFLPPPPLRSLTHRLHAQAHGNVRDAVADRYARNPCGFSD